MIFKDSESSRFFFGDPTGAGSADAPGGCGMSEEECDEYEYEDDFEEDESEDKQPTPRKEPTPRRPRAAPPAPAAPPTPAAPPSPPIPSPVISPAAKQQPWSLITLDDLERGEHIASGSMGSIYAATWRGRRVALKSLHDPTSSALKETEEELLVHAALGHKHIVELLGANLAPRGCCIVLELCRESLFVRLYRRREEMERRTMVTIALHVARAVEYMHARSPSVVHRDIKSHNVLLDFDGTAKLCDFGLVNTREVTAGTPNYMAPELFLGKARDRARREIESRTPARARSFSRP